VSPQEAIAQALFDPSTTTLDIAQVAVLLGISKSHCYHTVLEEGAVAGVPVIRVGSRIKVPAEPIRRLLGVNTTVQIPESQGQSAVSHGWTGF